MTVGRRYGFASMVCIAWLGFAQGAAAQQDPPECNQPGAALSLQAYQDIAATVLVTGAISPCQTIYYRAILTKAPGPSVCAFRGGQFALTTPDGTVTVLSTNVPCLGGTGANGSGCNPANTQLLSPVVQYTVKPSDIVGGFVTAVTNYGIGVSLDGVPPTPGVAASVAKTTPVASCADHNVCTIDLCDPALGCRHVVSPRCRFGLGLSLKATTAYSTFSFKRQDGSGTTGDFVKVTLQEGVLTSSNEKLVKQKVKVNVVLAGADAGIASLLYPVAALASGNGALAALQALGLDVSATGAIVPCTDQLPADTCTALAQQLAHAIDAQLALGETDERDAFHQLAQTLGYLSDGACCAPTTCAIQNANCGSIPDGCGGTLDCGTCTAPLTCGGAGIANQCGIIF
jgi:hypothetical protein